MAMERVERRLRRVTGALYAAGIPYAVVGGNAVAAWVAKAKPAATRTTKHVDLLPHKCDPDRITAALSQLGFAIHDLRRMVIFVDPDEPDRECGVRLVWSGEKVRTTHPHSAPSVEEAVLSSEGYRVLDLPALVRMKLTSFRDIDRVHVADMLRVGLIDQRIREGLPPDLGERLAEVESTFEMDD